MENALRSHLSSLLSSEIISIVPLSGGDIAKAYILRTFGHQFFCKTLSSPSALSLLKSEKLGLEQIAKAGEIGTPEIYVCDSFRGTSFLVMEYIESKQPSSADMRRFGRELANLHMANADCFGWSDDNYIGLLTQYNTKHDDWALFYVKERLIPQLELAVTKQLLAPKQIPTPEKMLKVMTSFCLNVKPSLLHGDLWGGNYLISSGGVPYLIDPASYYGHSEVDLAMSQLFGGFSKDFYFSYYEVLPQTEGNEERLSLYQLYYLLVHLNLFGSSYYASVSGLLKRFF